MAFKDFEELEKSFHAAGKKTVAVAAAQDKSALTAVRQCRKEGLVDAILIGDEALIREEIKAFDGDLDDCEIIDAKTLEEAAQKTCQCVRDGKADFILKGKGRCKRGEWSAYRKADEPSGIFENSKLPQVDCTDRQRHGSLSDPGTEEGNYRKCC